MVRSGTVDEIVLVEQYETERTHGTPDLASGDLVVDAGAHIGAVAVVLARRHPHASVIALEPSHDNFALLSRNVALNALLNLHPVRAALAPQAGTTTLHLSDESWGHTTEADERASDVERVPAMDLEQLAARHPNGEIALLRMNIEGGEYPVILDGVPGVLQRVGRIELEFHAHPRYGGGDIVERLRALGFAVGLRPSHTEQGKGWISARMV